MQNFVRMFVGGYGSGKTVTLCKRHIWLALKNPDIPTAMVSPTYSMAKETIIATTIELLEYQVRNQKRWGNYFAYETRQTSPFEFRITFQKRDVNGQPYKVRRGRILVYSGEDPKKLKGPNLSSAGIDEPFIQDQAVFEQMTYRVRHRRAVVREVNLTGTPEQLNWGYELAEGDLADKYDVGIIQASTMENKLGVGEGYVDQLLTSMDPKMALAYVHGMFVNLAKGLVFHCFDRDENVVPLNAPPGAELGAGMDFNVNPMTAAVFWVVRKGANRHIHFFDEIELANSDTKEMAGELKSRYWDYGLRTIYPDANCGRSTSSPGGKTDYDYLKEAGFELDMNPSGNPLRRDRFNATNTMLRATGGRVRMTIGESCPKLKKYMMMYSHDLINKENQKAMSHLLDAATYPVARLFPSNRESFKQLRLSGI